MIQSRGKRARALFEAGANCAQAVAGAFADAVGMEETELFKLASGFGGGVGRMREVCGAVSGMVIIYNILHGNPDIADKDAKLYASEGQQKSAAIAIRLAQFEMLKKYLQTEPIILCDDILGELDASRRNRFWDCTSSSAEIIATATEPPTTKNLRQWKIINAENGSFR
jgi:C_GCAxxG_C_C family probable redox protein